MVHLFSLFLSQLFGEVDPDEDVSPDAADPELVGQAGQSALDTSGPGTSQDSNSASGTSQDTQSTSNGNVSRVSTRAWAVSHDYCPKVRNGMFCCDSGAVVRDVSGVARSSNVYAFNLTLLMAL